MQLSAATPRTTSSLVEPPASPRPEIQANLASFEPVEQREQVTQSWALEPTVRTQEEFHRVMVMQMPFHFMTSESDAYRRYMAASNQTVYAPEVLAYFSEHESAPSLFALAA